MGGRSQPLEHAREFGTRVRATRKALDWSLETLADEAGLHWTYVGSVERGERNISLLNILRLAVALDVDAGELVRGLKP
ncbi:helix-turn-helix domain-containing protein [Novosphingobium sp.]|uniref:helix-turn-helix domain-containing protein n=1 Tax=Novosphingobium sp. TaxID=1874826 RepID=UPI003D6CBE1F